MLYLKCELCKPLSWSRPDLKDCVSAVGTVLRVGACRVRRVLRSCALSPRLLPAPEMALVCDDVGSALALLRPLPRCPLRQARTRPQTFADYNPALVRLGTLGCPPRQSHPSSGLNTDGVCMLHSFTAAALC